MGTSRAHTAPPVRVADELQWDLLRDEWDLLLAIGTGPTDAATAAERIGLSREDTEERVALLVEHRLLRQVEGGYTLVPVFHQRQEGMASYLRDMVLRRIDLVGMPPLAGHVLDGVGGADAVGRLLERADNELFPAVVELANRPETDRSERYAIHFAVASECPGADCGDELVTNLLRVLRAAATQRCHPERAPGAKLWVAEMRTDPEIATAIGDLFDTFIAETPTLDGPGSLAYVILPSDTPGLSS